MIGPPQQKNFNHPGVKFLTEFLHLSYGTLQVNNRILYRVCELGLNLTGFTLQRVPYILEELHSEVSGGLLGVDKMLEKV